MLEIGADVGSLLARVWLDPAMALSDISALEIAEGRGVLVDESI